MTPESSFIMAIVDQVNNEVHGLLVYILADVLHRDFLITKLPLITSDKILICSQPFNERVE